MESRNRWLWIVAAVVVALGVWMFLRSPSGEAAIQAVDNVSEQVTGNQAVRESVRVREQLDDIDASRLEQLEEVEASGEHR